MRKGTAGLAAAAGRRLAPQQRHVWWRVRETEAEKQQQQRVQVMYQEPDEAPQAAAETTIAPAPQGRVPDAGSQGATDVGVVPEKFQTPLFAGAPKHRQAMPRHEVEDAPARKQIEFPEMPVDPVISFIQQGKELLDGIDDGGDCRMISETGVEGMWCLQLENLGEGNAVTGEMMKKLEEAMRMVNRHLKTNGEILALVIRGSGLNFSYGTSKSIHQELSSGEEGLIISRYMSSILLELKQLPVVTIAAMEGVTAGSAAEIALACDFRIAAEDSMIQFSDVANGVTPGWGGASTLADLTSPRTALLLTASGKPVSPEEALDLGVVDCVTKPGDTYNEAVKFVETNLHDSSGLGGQFGETTWRRHSIRRMKENVAAASMFASNQRAVMDIEGRNFQMTWAGEAKPMVERRQQAVGLKRASIRVALEDWATITDPHAMSLPLHEDVGHGLFPTHEDSKFGLVTRNVEKAFTSLFERKANQPLLGSPQSESFVKHKYVPETKPSP